MSAYDAKAWNAILDYKTAKERRRIAPRQVRELGSRAARSGGAAAGRIPGADKMTAAVQEAMSGLQGMVDDLAVASFSTSGVLKRFHDAGHTVDELNDIAGLNLKDIDKVRTNSLKYVVGMAAEGAGAGFAMSGGEAMAAAGTVFGAGAGAAPGIAVLVGATAVDAVAVLAASSRLVAETAAYYGYDVSLPHERLFATAVLGVGLAPEGGKTAAYLELNRLAQALARRKSWEVLNKRVTTKIISRIYSTFGIRLTQRKLGQALPVVGIVIGAGLNAATMRRVAMGADFVYRERFLQEKYGLENGAADVNLTEPGEGHVGMVHILEEEIIEAEIMETPPERA